MGVFCSGGMYMYTAPWTNDAEEQEEEEEGDDGVYRV